MNGVLVKIGMPWTVSIDVFPCLDGVEMQFCWGNSYNGPIFIVKKLVFEGNTTFEKSHNSGNRRDRVKFWAREFG